MVEGEKSSEPQGQPAPGANRPHGDFFQRVLVSTGEWTRFADPKLLGVLALLGLGLANIISRAGPLWDAQKQDSFWGWTATGSFLAAGAFAVLTVVFASLGLFPRLKAVHHEGSSLYYFDGVAKYDNPAAYEAAVRAKTPAELDSVLACQAWEVSRVAAVKHMWARRGYYAVTLFLVFWVLARVALSFVT